MSPASSAAPSAGPSPAETARLQAALWRLLAPGDRDGDDIRAVLDEVGAVLAHSDEPYWSAWRSAVAARAALVDGEPDAVGEAGTAARTALHECLPSAWTALALAYLAHVEVTADHVDAAMLMAVDASLLTEEPSAQEPSRALLQAHRWLSLTLAGLDLEELAVAHAGRAHRVAGQLPDVDDQWHTLLLSAQQHVELAQTLRRRGDEQRAAELAEEAIGCAGVARELDREPEPAEADLLDVVQAWALTCTDDLDGALGPLRRVHRHVRADGGVWLRGYTELVLARLLVRLAARDSDPLHGEEAVQLLVDAAGAFASSGDRRRYRQCLLELGRNSADLGRTADALHWLEAYRADTGRAHARGRQLWAEMFVRRSRLREAERQAAVLRRHALEDPLTGLGNRRSAERRLAGLRLGEEPLSLAVVDVDRFKQVNDGASHTQGDVVLRRVADLLREHSRTNDEVYRWAGDEFLVLLPTATEGQAVAVMERLRSAVASADWSELRLTEPVTVSVGVATAPEVAEGHPEPVVGWRTLFESADLLLFSAKRSGRNRVRAPGGAPPADASSGPAAGSDDRPGA
ncbi:GGDEF domain-containing protein [Candidatus Blastococcus massiliensis]|uniref:GGDEF domain-containing protein n=1 Tax=Candidatus Blastococcus massiliensis TaxID=1470358 RepID=UPI001E5C5F0D|nr:GGDEF domain-containing protein [Candidatus Blastococcus massiliensis]